MTCSNMQLAKYMTSQLLRISKNNKKHDIVIYAISKIYDIAIITNQQK